MDLLSALYSQFFVTPTLPNHDFSNQTIIVTGANTGLGFEAAKHFLALHCAKIIIAVRSTSKGESAKQSLLKTIPGALPSQIEVWALDLSSFKSVRAFADRASSQLGRVDVLVENAGLDEGRFVLSEDGWERTLQINVISTCLLAVLMLPKLRETAQRYKVTPHLVVVTSDTHYWAKFEERHAEGGILKALNEEEKFNGSDRYVLHICLQINSQTSCSQSQRMLTSYPLSDTQQPSSSKSSSSASLRNASTLHNLSKIPKPPPPITHPSSPCLPQASAIRPSSAT